jgi:hypothetical protein
MIAVLEFEGAGQRLKVGGKEEGEGEGEDASLRGLYRRLEELSHDFT